METVKVIYNFSKLKDDELDTKSEGILKKMTGNVNFPAPIPSLEKLAGDAKAYSDALIAAPNGGVESTALKNATRKELVKTLRLLGLYVQTYCQDNESIALSSGFAVQKAATPVGVLAKPENFEVLNGPASGSLEIRCKKIEGAKSYVFEFTTAPITTTTVWTARYGTSRSYLFDNLKRGTEYAFRMAGIGTNPMLVYSDELTEIAQ